MTESLRKLRQDKQKFEKYMSIGGTIGFMITFFVIGVIVGIFIGAFLL